MNVICAPVTIEFKAKSKIIDTFRVFQLLRSTNNCFDLFDNFVSCIDSSRNYENDDLPLAYTHWNRSNTISLFFSKRANIKFETFIKSMNILKLVNRNLLSIILSICDVSKQMMAMLINHIIICAIAINTQINYFIIYFRWNSSIELILMEGMRTNI